MTAIFHCENSVHHFMDLYNKPPTGCEKRLPFDLHILSHHHFNFLQTLPPIKQVSMEEQRRREKAQRKFDKKYWGRPQPPKPFLLHLGVTARTHDIPEFQQNFPEEYKNFYVDRYEFYCEISFALIYMI